MTPHNKLTQDEIIAKIDQSSRKSRIVSIALSVLLVLILAVLSFISISVKTEVDAMQTTKEELSETIRSQRKTKEDLDTTIEKAKLSVDNNPNCAETKSILANVDTGPPTVGPTPAVKPPIAPAVTGPARSYFTVYIQIVNESQRQYAKRLIPALADTGYRFPGIEKVPRDISTTQVRYFHREDKPAADEIKDRLNKAGQSAVTVYTDIKASNKQLEIWFANDAFAK